MHRSANGLRASSSSSSPPTTLGPPVAHGRTTIVPYPASGPRSPPRKPCKIAPHFKRLDALFQQRRRLARRRIIGLSRHLLDPRNDRGNGFQILWFDQRGAL